MKKSLLSVGSICAMAVALSYSAPARADMDYSSLQELFGEPVTVGATGTPQKASEVAADMTIITADEIRQSGSRSIPEILSRVPGLDILQTSATSYDVGVRGYQQPFQPRLLVLIDGRQVFNDDYSRMSWSNLPVNIDDIRQIEVVEGASSALFGSNATGGVVNIITYSPEYDKNNVASVSLGTQHELTGDGTATVGLGDLGGVKVSAGGFDMHEFNTSRPAAEQVGEITNPYHRYIAQSSVFKVNDNLKFNTEANYSEGTDNAANFVYAEAAEKATTYSAGAGMSLQTPYGLIKNNNYVNHYYYVENALGGLQDSNTLIVSQLEDQFKIGSDNTFRAMLEYRNKDFKAENTLFLAQETPDLREDSFAASGTWLWQITDKLSMTNALRVDRNDMHMGGVLEANAYFPPSAYGQTYDTVSANSGLVYKATDMDTFRATYGRGIENPSEIESGFDESFHTAPPVNINYLGNPNLKPTITEDYQLGYDRKVPQIFSTAKISVYYELNKDLKAVAPNGTFPFNAYGLNVGSINVGDSKGWGTEIELKGSHPSGFRWDASYSYQTIRDSDLVATSLDYAKSAPENHFRLLAGYTLGKWEMDAMGQYVSSTDMLRSLNGGSLNTEIATAGYASLTGRIGYSINDHVTAAISGVNIDHENLQASPYPQIERQALVTLTDKF